MSVIERSNTVNAPLERVFALLDAPERLAEWTPGITRVADVKQTPQRTGDSSRVTYSVLGLRFPTKLTVLDYAKPRKLTVKMEGGLRGTVAWNLEPTGSAAKVTVRFDYTMKGGILGKAVNALLVERMNEKNTERMLENLKIVVEGEAKK